MLEELLVIALPIGNMEDLSPRARRALEELDGVLAEDTRRFRDFCQKANVNFKGKIESFFAEKERDLDSAQVFAKLRGRWALVSDAGSPSISDPGSLLVREARQRGIRLRALPGPSALSLALQWSGGFGTPVAFLGFPPKKLGLDFFENASFAKTIVIFVSMHQVLEVLSVLAGSPYQNSKLVALREMTKAHEELFEGSVADHLDHFSKLIEHGTVGEITFVLEGPGEVPEKRPLVDIQSLLLIREGSPTQAAKSLASILNVSRKEAYEIIQQNENSSGDKKR